MFSKPSASSNYEHIYSEDPAVDANHPDLDLEKYRETGDTKWLPLLAGQEPTVFVMRHLRGKAKALVNQMLGKGDWITTAYDACALALVQVRNGKMPDGTAFEPAQTPDPNDKILRIPEKDMAVLYEVGDGGLVLELGLRAIRETLGDPLSKRA